MKAAGILLILAGTLLLPAALPVQGEPLLVFCGFANQGPAEEIAAGFEEASGTRVELIFGTGGRLLAQIKLARRGDIFWPGSEDFIALARRDGLLAEQDHLVAAYHLPALFVPPGNPGRVEKLADLARPGIRVVIPNPQATAAGRAAIELLEKNGLLEEVMKNVAAFSATPPQAARFAAAGQVDAALTWDIYRTRFGRQVETVPLDPEIFPRLVAVPAAILAGSRRPEAAAGFLEYLASESARSVLAEAGFLDPGAADRFPRAELGGLYTLPPLNHPGKRP